MDRNNTSRLPADSSACAATANVCVAGRGLAQLVWYWYCPIDAKRAAQRIPAPGPPGSRPRPLAYVRLRQALRGTIEAGVVGPGQALPGERELAKWLDLSRVTVRKAIDGPGRRRPADPAPRRRHLRRRPHRRARSRKLTSFTDDLRARGLNPRSVFLEREHRRGHADEAMALNLSPGGARGAPRPRALCRRRSRWRWNAA